MKKLLLALTCCLVLGGCGQKTQTETSVETVQDNKEKAINVPIEYTYSDIKELSEQFWDMYQEEFDKLSDAEIYGLSDDEENQNENYFEASEKCAHKAEENLEILRGQKIIVTGYIFDIFSLSEDGFFAKNGCGNIVFHLKRNASDNEFRGLTCKTNDKKFLSLKDNTPVKIEAIFLKPGLSGDNSDLYECKIIESGTSEEVETIPEITAVPNLD